MKKPEILDSWQKPVCKNLRPTFMFRMSYIQTITGKKTQLCIFLYT